MSNSPQFGANDSPFQGNGTANKEPFVVNPVRLSLRKCTNHFLKFNNIMSIVSFFISFTAFIILIRNNPKHRHFPFNLGPLICLSAAIFSLERTLIVLFKSYLDDDIGRNQICWIIGFTSQIGKTSLLYWWMCSTVVLYQVIVRQVPVSVIRSRRKYYYRTVLSIIVLLFLIQQIVSQYYYIPIAGTCAMGNVELTWVVNYGHAVIGVLLFLAFGAPVIKVLLSKRDVNLIDPERVSRLREEGVLQIILGVLIFLTALSNSIRGVFWLLMTRLESPYGNSFLQAIAYPSCAFFQSFIGTLGTLIGLAYLCNKVDKTKVQYCFKSKQNLVEDNPNDGANESVAFKEMKTPDKNSFAAAPRTKCYEEYITSFRDNGRSSLSESMIDVINEEDYSSSKTNTSGDS